MKSVDFIGNVTILLPEFLVNKKQLIVNH